MNENWVIPDVRPDGVWFVDQGAVSWDHLVHARLGSIIPCRYLPAVQYVPPSTDDYERIAGMISDAA
jgi:hypothetical protein